MSQNNERLLYLEGHYRLKASFTKMIKCLNPLKKNHNEWKSETMQSIRTIWIPLQMNCRSYGFLYLKKKTFQLKAVNQNLYFTVDYR